MKETKMNIFPRFANKWVMALLLVTFVAGCGDDNADGVWNAPAGTANEMTAYSLDGTDGVVTEGTTSKTIAVVMPFGTDLSLPLIATYTTTGASVMVDTVVQESGVTENVFLSVPQAPVIYTVTAEDGSIATYDVNITVAASNVAVMTSYSLGGNPGIVNEIAVPKTIDVIMPFGTDPLLPLIATFVATGDVEIDMVLQESGITGNVFPLSPPASAVYTVIAADGIATATYEVNVTVAANDAAAITSYSLDGAAGIISENTTPKTIDVVMPLGTDLSLPLIATFLTTGDSVTIDAVIQVSAQTENVFSAPVLCTVLAADGVSTATYEVNVTVLVPNPLAPELGEAGRFVILASQLVSTTVGSVISNGDIGVEDQARTFMTGFTDVGSEGAFAELTNGMSYGFDDVNPLPYPYPLKTATLPIGSEWATTNAMLTQAKGDLLDAYNFLAADPNPDSPTQVCPIQLGGLTLNQGVYKTDVDVQITTGDLHLDALGDPNAVFIFSIGGILTTGAPGGNIILDNGALAKNVYFRTGGATIIAGNTFFKGNILAWSQINVDNLADITGRLFALTDQVTLISDTVTKP
jgi:hypothetical protein